MATFTGTSGNDTFTGGAEADSASGQAGNDTLRGGGGNDTLLGGTGNDHLHGDDGDDSLFGDAGADTHFGGAGNDFFDGGSITDRTNYSDLNALDYRATIFDAGGVVVNLSGITGDAGTGSGTVAKGAGGALGTDTVANVNFVTGSHGNDQITLSTAIIFENVNGTLGNDTIDGGATENRFFPAYTNRISYTSITGPVTIDLRAGTVVKPTGTDSITNFTLARGSAQDDQIYGSDDPVRAEWFYGEGGSDTIDGRGGFDYVRYDLIPGTSGVSIRLDTSEPQADGQGGSDRLFNIEGIVGSPNADVFTGTAQANRLDGRGGDDTIDGGPGNDVIDGGANLDTASYATAPAGVVAIIIGSGGGATGGGGTDVFFNIENLIGSPSADTLVGASTGSRLEGGAGNDSISGSSGASDALVGGPGDDTLDGGAITDRAGYTDSNQASYAAATTGVVVSLAGVTGIGSTGSGTAEDGEGGTDVLRHINMIEGSAHDDRITGSSALQFEVFIGGLGNDTIDGGSLADPVQRTLNRANYAAATNPVTVNLAAGTTSGAHGNDVLININGVQTGSGADTLLGSDRSDVTEQFAGGAGADSIDGRGGIDFLRYDTGGAGGALTIDLQDGISSDGDVFVNIEGVYGSSFNDTIFGREAAPDTIMGMAGNDSIDGGAGPGDVVWYFRSTAGINLTLPGTGSSTAADGHGGTDTLVGIEGVRGSHHADTLTGSTLQETFEGSVGNDTIDGGSNFDTTSYELSWYQGAVVDLSAGIAHDDGFGDTDTLISIENVTGTLIYGDHLTGHGGGSILRGLGGNDTLIGLAGRDTFEAGTGIDVIDGGEHIDLLRLPGTRADYAVSRVGETGVRLVRAAAAEDVTITAVENVAFADQTLAIAALLGTGNTPTPFADLLSGPNADPWTVDGQAGDDSIAVQAFATNDSLSGGAGNDTIAAGRAAGAGVGSNADTVDGGNGTDTLQLQSTRNQYGFTELPEGVVQVFNGNTGERVLMRDIEYIAFSDQTVTLGSMLVGSGPSEYADSILGTGGSDSIDALSGNDTVDGGNGNDTVIGGFGADVLRGAGADRSGRRHGRRRRWR